jgi:hypothetical protein
MRKLIQLALIAAMAASAMTGCTIYLPPDEDDPDDPSWPPPYPEPPPPYPYPEPPPPPYPEPPPPSEGDWIAYDFQTLAAPTCDGERFVRYAPAYDRWVGAILCGSAERYKLYMSASQDDLYFEIADYAGHGQDHCELVDPEFFLPNDDDITSGGCASCALGELVDVIDVPVYVRGYNGEPFRLASATYWADLTTTWYECGVAISGKPGDPTDPGDPNDPLPPSEFKWSASDFLTYDGVSYCDGKRFTRFDDRYQLWVGAEVCDAGLYKLYLSDSEDGTYYEIADYGGHGQDHCELVNASFALPNEDDITSGGCSGCAVGDVIDLIDVPVYARGSLGEPFEFVISRDWADLTTDWYRCGVTIE